MNRKRRTRRRRTGRILLALVAVTTLAVAWMWDQSRRPPEWYAPPAPDDAAVVVLAEQVEYGIVENFHKVRPDAAPWTVRIREHQVNAWLAVRLPEWLEGEESVAWPEALGTPQVQMSPDGIYLAVPIAGEGTPRVVVTRIDARIEEGTLRIDVERVGVGRLSVPGGAATTLLAVVDRFAADGMLADAFTEQIIAFAADPTLGEHARFDLTDGRRIELLDIEIKEGALELTSRTLPKE